VIFLLPHEIKLAILLKIHSQYFWTSISLKTRFERFQFGIQSIFKDAENLLKSKNSVKTQLEKKSTAASLISVHVHLIMKIFISTSARYNEKHFNFS
jgi:hypothetical protein